MFPIKRTPPLLRYGVAVPVVGVALGIGLLELRGEPGEGTMAEAEVELPRMTEAPGNGE